VITGATINSPTARTSRCRRPRLQSAMRNQDCSPPHWMVGYNAKAPEGLGSEIRMRLAFVVFVVALLNIGSAYSEAAEANPTTVKPGTLQWPAEQAASGPSRYRD
jgi:hypothetical protein